MVVSLLAVGIFALVWMQVRLAEHRALHTGHLNEQLTPSGQVRPAADVLQAVRQMQLVTVEISTRITATVEHDSWRGDVTARVEAPARLLYGIDLSHLQSGAVQFSPVSRAYLVRIPPPRRVATEVCTHEEEFEVHVGWLRLRSRAGEFHLGRARRELTRRAQELVLSPDDAALVRESTLRQVEAMIRRILGDAGRGITVSVIFDEDLSPHATHAEVGETP